MEIKVGDMVKIIRSVDVYDSDLSITRFGETLKGRCFKLDNIQTSPNFFNIGYIIVYKNKTMLFYRDEITKASIVDIWREFINERTFSKR